MLSVYSLPLYQCRKSRLDIGIFRIRPRIKKLAFFGEDAHILTPHAMVRDGSISMLDLQFSQKEESVPLTSYHLLKVVLKQLRARAHLGCNYLGK